MFKTLLSLLPMFVCAFWCIVLAMPGAKHNRTHTFLSLFMLLNTILYFSHALYFNKEFTLLYHLEPLYYTISLAGYPLYYLYLLLLTDPRKIGWRDCLILLPSLLLGLLAFIINGTIFHWESQNFALGIRENFIHLPSYEGTLRKVLLAVIKIVYALQVPLVIYYGYKSISLYRKKLNDFYSNEEGKDLSHIRNLLVCFIITALLSFTVNLIGKEYFAQSSFILLFPSLIFGTFLFLIGYYGMKQEFTALDFERDENSGEKAEEEFIFKSGNSTCTNSVLKQIAWTLNKSMVEKELFKTKELRITDLTFLIGTNRTYLSQAINQEFGCSFSEFVNQYRIAYAKKLMKDETLSICEIADMAGFASESTFFRIFKKATGMSPDRWRKKK